MQRDIAVRWSRFKFTRLLSLPFYVAVAIHVTSTSGWSAPPAAPSQSPGTDLNSFPTLARVISTNANHRKISLSACCHIIIFYGLGPTDLPILPSGAMALKTLTDEETAIQACGKSPFVRTRNGLRYYVIDDPLGRSEVGETHRDQVLATFSGMNLPLDTPIHLKAGTYHISDLVSESTANFSFDQGEPAWTAIAYAKYLPPKREWVNRFQERTTFSQLASYLLSVDMSRQSCAGTHIFQALAKIDAADRLNPILDKKVRDQLHSYLQAKVEQIIKSQESQGSWNWNWCDAISMKAPISSKERVLITGHLLETLNGLDSSIRPPENVFVRGAGWLDHALRVPDIPVDDGTWLCPFTHAARCLREVTLRNQGMVKRHDSTNFVAH